MFGLYDYIYNRVEEAGNAIQDVATKITCPDVDKYVEKTKLSDDKEKKEKKKDKKKKIMSEWEFKVMVAELEKAGTVESLTEADIIRHYEYGDFTNCDRDKLLKRLRKAYSNGKTVYDLLTDDGYKVKVKNGTWKVKKIKKKKSSSADNSDSKNVPDLDAESLSMIKALGEDFDSKFDDLVKTILEACDCPDDIDYILEYLAENNGMQISVDVSNIMFNKADKLKRIKKEMNEAENNEKDGEEIPVPETVSENVDDQFQTEEEPEPNSDNSSDNATATDTADGVIPLPDLQAEKSTATDTGNNKPVVQPVTDIPPMPKKPEPKNKTKQQKSKKEKENKTEPENEGSDSEPDKMNFADAAGIKVD